MVTNWLYNIKQQNQNSTKELTEALSRIGGTSVSSGEVVRTRGALHYNTSEGVGSHRAVFTTTVSTVLSGRARGWRQDRLQEVTSEDNPHVLMYGIGG